jgi:hypothetical protein
MAPSTQDVSIQFDRHEVRPIDPKKHRITICDHQTGEFIRTCHKVKLVGTWFFRQYGINTDACCGASCVVVKYPNDKTSTWEVIE